jgi:ABC-2 type transport system ATP-binding protein
MTVQATRAPTTTRLSRPEDGRLVLSSVSKTWDRRRAPVLDAVDLTVEPGTLLSLIGGNGAGKTTLLRIAAGLIGADSGTVLLDGLEPFQQRRQFQCRLGFLSAGQSGLYARLPVEAHLEYWARIALLPRRDRPRVIAQAIREFQLSELVGRRVDRLSMGQRQRVRLAMAFLHEPRLVLLDEPQNSLDEEGIGLLNGVIARFTRERGSVICCSPGGERIEGAEETLELRDGRLHRR